MRSAGVDWVRDRVPRRATLCSARGARDSAVAEWVVAAVMADAKRAREVGEGQATGTWRAPRARRRRRAAGRDRRLRVDRPRGGPAAARPGLHGRRGGPAPAQRRARPRRPRTADRGRRRPRRPRSRSRRETEGLVDATLLSLLHPAAPGDQRRPRADARHRRPRGRARDAAGCARSSTSSTPSRCRPTHPLWRTPGTVVSPHVAGDTPLAEERAWALCGGQLRRFAAGEPLRNVVGPDGY